MIEKCAFCGKVLLNTDEEVCLDESEIDGIFCNETCAKKFVEQTVKKVDTKK